jgi:multidrug transporter EmrE-like cation transporter
MPSAAVYGYCFALSIVLCAGQIMFKLAALHQPEGGFSIAKLLTSVWFLAAICLYGLSTILWVYILVKLPLSIAYPFSLAGAALVPIFAYFTFNETLGLRTWLGFGLILGGLYVMNTK